MQFRVAEALAVPYLAENSDTEVVQEVLETLPLREGRSAGVYRFVEELSGVEGGPRRCVVANRGLGPLLA